MKTILFLALYLIFGIYGQNSFDPYDFQKKLGRPCIVNGTHSISGAVFTPEPPVVLVKAVKTLWTFLPFPHVPHLDPEPLNQILENALNRLTDLDLRMFSRECADPHLFKYWKRFLQDNLAEIFQSHRMFQHDWLAMKKSLTVFLNHTVNDVRTGKPDRLSQSVVWGDRRIDVRE